MEKKAELEKGKSETEYKVIEEARTLLDKSNVP